MGIPVVINDGGPSPKAARPADNLRTTKDAASAWGVTRQRAHAHVVRLHQKYGVGVQIGARWLLTVEEIDAHHPDARYRRKEAHA